MAARNSEARKRHEATVIGGAGGSDEWTALVDPSAVPDRVIFDPLVGIELSAIEVHEEYANYVLSTGDGRIVCLPCDDDEHGSCYGGRCQCPHGNDDPHTVTDEECAADIAEAVRLLRMVLEADDAMADDALRPLVDSDAIDPRGLIEAALTALGAVDAPESAAYPFHAVDLVDPPAPWEPQS